MTNFERICKIQLRMMFHGFVITIKQTNNGNYMVKAKNGQREYMEVGCSYADSMMLVYGAFCHGQYLPTDELLICEVK